MKNILAIHWGSKGGGPKFLFDIASALAETDGLKLHLSYSSYADNYSDLKSLSVGHHEVRTYRNNTEFLLGLPRLIKSGYLLRRYIRANEIDCVYSTMLSLWHSLVIWLALPRKVTYVGSVHDATEHPGDEHPLKRLSRLSEILRSNAIVTYSEYVSHQLSKEFPSKDIVHVPMGIDLVPCEARTLKSDTVVLGFFGRILDYKGIDVFVESVNILRSRGLDVIGAVYGDGEVSKDMIENTSHFIRWNIGWVNDDQIDEIFSSFNIVVLPYTEASQSGVVSLAAGRGVPIVATPVGGLAEQVYSCGGGLVAEEPTALSVSSVISSLLSNPSEYQRLSKAAIDSARGDNSWQKSGVKLSALFARLGADFQK